MFISFLVIFKSLERFLCKLKIICFSLLGYYYVLKSVCSEDYSFFLRDTNSKKQSTLLRGLDHDEQHYSPQRG